MNKLLKFKAGEVFEKQSQVGSTLCEFLILTISFPLITYLNEVQWNPVNTTTVGP